MNYIRLIHSFYEKQLIYNLSAGQISLWHALVSINNKCFWKGEFTVANQTLMLLTGLSRSAINKNRAILKEKGLINYTPNTTTACQYSVVDISNYELFKTSGNKSGKASSNCGGKEDSTLINKNKNINNIYKKKNRFNDYRLTGDELERHILAKNDLDKF